MTAIKVNRLKLIDAINEAISVREDGVTARIKEWADYDKEIQKWVLRVMAHNKTKASAGANEYSHNNYDGTIRLVPPESLPMPVAPTEGRPSAKTYFGAGRNARYTSYSGYVGEELNELRNTLKLLEMSSEESVNASVYKSVTQYL